MDLTARTDDAHREIFALLPDDLFDLSDLEAAISRLSILSAPSTLPDGVVAEDHRVAARDGHQIEMRVYRPRSARGSLGCLYWIHGGGLVLGDVSMDDAWCAEVVEQLGVVVASVEYRLAPAFPYPAPLDDCVDGLAWLFTSCQSLGVDPARIAIGGGSAGGGLAAALALRRRDEGGSQPCFQFLRYPMLDDRQITQSSQVITDLRVWNRSANLVGWGSYLGEAVGTDDVPAYAAASRATDLSDLPPALITVGELDLFLDEDIEYAQRLLAAGVSTELHVYAKCIHGSDVLAPHSEPVQRWKRDEFDALARALAG